MTMTTEERIIKLEGEQAAMNARMSDMNSRFAEVRADMNSRFAEVRADMNAHPTEPRDDMDTRFAELRASMNRQFAIMFGMTLIGLTLALADIFLT